ncbi:DUF5011 domain-containing protein [Staphylococcus caeli]|uniref:Chitinase n=1 Tax=Staphylococcus caeli TaxID=2201815 RepID=A0A1D4INK8_9STAP|nr:DUF5011 domain-containing protein [Staphylococcus caeli]SCS50886.1 chitinase [Staphylococcus caeli]SCS92422.1 chitinase [Staphylococcus caeli]
MNKLIQSLSAIGVSATLVSPNLSAEATDNSIPELKGINDTVIKKGNDYNLLNGVRAYDKEDGDLTHKITVDGKIDTQTAGKYKIEYTVEDSDGASNKSIRYIEVK